MMCCEKEGWREGGVVERFASTDARSDGQMSESESIFQRLVNWNLVGQSANLQDDCARKFDFVAFDDLCRVSSVNRRRRKM